MKKTSYTTQKRISYLYIFSPCNNSVLYVRKDCPPCRWRRLGTISGERMALLMKTSSVLTTRKQMTSRAVFQVGYTLPEQSLSFSIPKPFSSTKTLPNSKIEVGSPCGAFAEASLNSQAHHYIADQTWWAGREIVCRNVLNGEGVHAANQAPKFCPVW